MKFCKNFARSLFFLAVTSNNAPARFAFADDETEAPEEFKYERLLSKPETRWTAQIMPDANLGAVNVEAGNGAFMAPDGKHVMVTTVGATVYAFNAYSGEQKWVYQPEAVGTSIARSHSAVIFSPTEEFMVYTVVDNENSLNPSSRVIALDMEGQQLWVSEDLEGIAAGNPQVSSDGLYVFLTHNGDDKSNGYFTILDATAGSEFYSGSSGEAGDDPTNAYGPVGIFHSPQQGNYDPIESGADVSEGDFNTNDMLMWSQTPRPSDVSIENGFIYGFQFPRDFMGNASDVSYFQMGNFERDFQAVTPPVMTNNGMSGYWSVSRSGFRGWTPKRFSRARSVTIGFDRNENFPGQPVWAVPALSNDGPEPMIFGGSAAKQFVRMSYDFKNEVTVDTEGYVKTTALVDGDERAVYYVESDTGTLHQADVETLEDNWSFPINFSVDGEMTITPRSDVVIIADTRGVVTALEVAKIPVTESPSDMPSDLPSLTPTQEPTMTKAPVETTSPSAAPTDVSVPEVTEAPVEPAAEDPVDDSATESTPEDNTSANEDGDASTEPEDSGAISPFTACAVAALVVVVSTITMM